MDRSARLEKLPIPSAKPSEPLRRVLRSCQSDGALLVDRSFLQKPQTRIDGEAVLVAPRRGAAAGRLKCILEEDEGLLQRIVRWWH